MVAFGCSLYILFRLWRAQTPEDDPATRFHPKHVPGMHNIKGKSRDTVYAECRSALRPYVAMASRISRAIHCENNLLTRGEAKIYTLYMYFL